MKTSVRIAAVATAFVLTGCASDLKIYEAKDGKVVEAKGVPFNAPAMVKVTTRTTYVAAPGTSAANARYCEPDEETSVDFLPLGDRFYAQVDPSQFADGEFSVEYNEKGMMSKISLNSKASSGVDKVNSLLSTVLPFVATPKKAPEEAPAAAKDPSAAELKAKHCLKKSAEVVSIKRATID